MARKRKHYRKEEVETIYDRLYRTILKYGSARIRVKVVDGWHDREYGTRVIDKSGLCRISYASNYNTYRKKYQESCFFKDCLENKKYTPKGIKVNLAEILRAMKKHDGRNLQISEVQYGPWFSKQMKLPKL